jgi:hypothetical protein
MLPLFCSSPEFCLYLIVFFMSYDILNLFYLYTWYQLEY